MDENKNILNNLNNPGSEKSMEALPLIRIIISGGGTGGHIFPAISIADALRKINNRIEILFVGDEKRMEMGKVPAAGYKIIGLPVAGFQRNSYLKNIIVLYKLFKSILFSRNIIKNFKPDIVVGVGGYASGPVLWTASLSKIPTVIQEQNSYAGITNKFLAKKAVRIFVAYEGMEKYFPKERIILNGNPVRQDIQNIESKRSEAFDYFNLEKDKAVILCLGGSLGAKTINQSIAANFDRIISGNVQFIWQSGSHYFADAKKLVENKNYQNIKLYDFISRMDLAYAAADIIISRAGAGSISELCIVGKPVILVPSPNVAEDHQTKNAKALELKNAALLIKDSEASEKLINIALELVNNKERCKMLSENIKKMAIHNSAENIAIEILKIVKTKNYFKKVA